MVRTIIKAILWGALRQVNCRGLPMLRMPPSLCASSPTVECHHERGRTRARSCGCGGYARRQVAPGRDGGLNLHGTERHAPQDHHLNTANIALRLVHCACAFYPRGRARARAAATHAGQRLRSSGQLGGGRGAERQAPAVRQQRRLANLDLRTRHTRHRGAPHWPCDGRPNPSTSYQQQNEASWVHGAFNLGRYSGRTTSAWAESLALAAPQVGTVPRPTAILPVGLRIRH
jgi:hypothetical protein